nr:ribonuclease H-like domain-containing protein [Tanacetum cinerariifolium]
NLHVEFLENKAIEKGAGPNWLFDINYLTKSMNYVPVDAGTNSTNFSGTNDAASQEVKKDVSSLRYIALPNWVHDALLESSSSKPQDESSTKVPEGSGNPNPTASSSNPLADQMETLTVEYSIPTDSLPVLTAYLNDSLKPSNILGVKSSTNEAIGVEADVSNMKTSITASPTLTLRIHKDHPKSQIIGPVDTLIQTRYKSKENLKRSLMLFKTQARPIGTKWVLKNKKDERGIVVKNKAKLVAQGYTQEEGIDYDEVFAHVARIKAIRLFLAYASFMGFTVYQMDVKSAFLYGTIDEEGKDGTGKDVDLHLYRSMIGSLMYLTASRPDIMFAICHPKLGLWYPKESPFDLVAYSDSDYGGASQDHKSTTGGSHFLGRRLISCQCKKQTIVATSTTKAEYVVAASYCGQVLWIQN